MKELVLGIVFLVISIFLLNGLSIVNTQGNVYYEYSNISTNLTQLFGEPILQGDKSSAKHFNSFGC